MGLLEDVTLYVWNWLVFSRSAGYMIGCWSVGGYGLVFDDDDGAMMKKCYDMIGGQSVTFPVDYISSYAEES